MTAKRKKHHSKIKHQIKWLSNELNKYNHTNNVNNLFTVSKYFHDLYFIDKKYYLFDGCKINAKILSFASFLFEQLKPIFVHKKYSFEYANIYYYMGIFWVIIIIDNAKINCIYSPRLNCINNPYQQSYRKPEFNAHNKIVLSIYQYLYDFMTPIRNELAQHPRRLISPEL